MKIENCFANRKKLCVLLLRKSKNNYIAHLMRKNYRYDAILKDGYTLFVDEG